MQGVAFYNPFTVIINHRPTQRAPDWWESARFQAVFWAQAGSVKATLPRPAHQRVTPAVSPLIRK